MEFTAEIYEGLKEYIKELEGSNKELRIQIAGLKAEIRELKDKLGVHSKTSSIPTSKELYRLKRGQIKSGRKAGGQPGHPGWNKERMIADEVIEISAPEVCRCGGRIHLSEKPYIHQRVNLPEIKPHVKEYRLRHGRCVQCGKRQSAALPKEAGTDMYGPRIKTIIAALSAFYKNSKRDIRQILKDMFNVPISLGSISNSEARVSPKCEKIYQEVQERVLNSKIVHIDETSHYNKSKRGWCWLFGNSQGTFIHLNPSRGQKVLEALMPKNQHMWCPIDMLLTCIFLKKTGRFAGRIWQEILRDSPIANTLRSVKLGSICET